MNQNVNRIDSQLEKDIHYDSLTICSIVRDFIPKIVFETNTRTAYVIKAKNGSNFCVSMFVCLAEQINVFFFFRLVRRVLSIC